jgi:hypothetical protein
VGFELSLTLARQAIYLLPHPSSSCFCYIFITLINVDAWESLEHSPTYASLTAGMTGSCHHTQLLLVEMRHHKLFCPGWP